MERLRIRKRVRRLRPLGRTYTWSEIEARLNRAISRVLDNDRGLLEFGPSERAVAHRLAVYLEHEFPEWHTDCEYNRQGGGRDRKRVQLDGSAEPSDVDPDIIVHKRGPHGPNLLAIEVKPARHSTVRDRSKLRQYIATHHYQFAVLVTYATGDDPRFNAAERITAASS